MVHVFGSPEDRALDHDECLCNDPPREGVTVTFHAGATEWPGVDGWTCSDCLFSTVRYTLQ